jgi:hypothetical protein
MAPAEEILDALFMRSAGEDTLKTDTSLAKIQNLLEVSC